MPTPLWEDLDVFLNTDDFALFGTVTFQSGDPPRTFPGIFDDPDVTGQLGEYSLETARPRFLCKETDTAGIVRGDTLLVFQKNKRGVVVWSKTFDLLAGGHATGDGMAVLELAPATE